MNVIMKSYNMNVKLLFKWNIWEKINLINCEWDRNHRVEQRAGYIHVKSNLTNSIYLIFQ